MVEPISRQPPVQLEEYPDTTSRWGLEVKPISVQPALQLLCTREKVKRLALEVEPISVQPSVQLPVQTQKVKRLVLEVEPISVQPPGKRRQEYPKGYSTARIDYVKRERAVKPAPRAERTGRKGGELADRLCETKFCPEEEGRCKHSNSLSTAAGSWWPVSTMSISKA